MIFESLIRSYVALNLLLTFVWLVLLVASLLVESSFVVISRAQTLKLTYGLLLISFIGSGLVFFGKPRPIFFPTHPKPDVELLASAGLGTTSPNTLRQMTTEFLPAAFEPDVRYTFQWILLLSIGCCLLQLALAYLRLYRTLKQNFLWKRFGAVRLLISEKVRIPFSCWVPGKYLVVLPQSVLGNAESLRLIVGHEIQHHRQADTKWLHVLELLRALCCWNPFVYLVVKKISWLQEFACDEALVGRRGFSSSAYRRCLLWAAEQFLQTQYALVGTAGMAQGFAGNILKRRMQMLEAISKQQSSRKGVCALAVASLVGIATISWASNVRVQDRTIRWDQALEMAKAASEGGGFPIFVNERILAQLNRFLGTPEGRVYLRKSFARMETYRPTIAKAIEKYGLPRELLAIPVVESAYQNREQDEVEAQGAGLWMFTRGTALAYGLRVEKPDQRLDVPLETDAAMRYLAGHNLQFLGDWGLTLLAYNAGGGRVSQGIEKTKSRDAWTLIDAGFENDPNYLAKVFAVVLIMKNPQILE